ncbi:MAG: hypothetical protein BGO09_13120 [Bacteroidetes bacterium 47-18]|nr:MAG: hypothetical protein BGO09_13120 [Bacteroidetes bacterium 47-18]
METNNTATFLSPNRMSRIGVLLLFVKQLMLYMRAFGLILILAVYRYLRSEAFETYGFRYVLLLLFVFFALVLVTAFLRYRNFRFYIDQEAEAFILEKGIFSKEKTIIRLEKIFQINLQQNVWQQVFDVYELEVETAGSARAEVRIPALSEPVANALKITLQAYALQHRSGDNIDAAGIPGEEVAASADRRYIGTGNIFYASLLSHYGNGLRVTLGFLLVLWSQFNDWAQLFSSQTEEERLMSWWEALDSERLLVIVVLLLLIPFVINTIRFVIKYYNISYQVLNPRELGIDYGLFTLQHRIFQVQKLQELNIVSNWFLRKKGISFVTLLQSDNTVGRRQKSTTVFPGMSDAQLAQLEGLFFGQRIQQGTVIRPYVNKLVLAMLLRLAAVAALGWFATAFFEMPVEGWWLAALILAWSWLMAVLRFRNDAFYLHKDFIIRQSGSLRRTRKIIEPHKIQHMEVFRKIWRPKFGSIAIYTASGVIYGSWYDYDTLYRWSEGLISEVSRTSRNWM